MKADERRKAIANLLTTEQKAVSGAALSAEFGVSRQIIVQDIMALRSSGYDIISTHNGYLIQKTPLKERVFKVYHTTERTEEELNLIVDLGGTVVFPEIINSTFSSSKTAFEISLGLTGVLSLWLGIMKIGEKGGVIALFSKLLSPIFSKLFPDIPKGHPVTGSIFMNLAANMLGLDNAATPLGLKAMEGLQELNPRKIRPAIP